MFFKMLLKSFCFRFSLRAGSITVVLIIIVCQIIVCIDAAIALRKDTNPLILNMITLISDQYIDELLETTVFSLFITGTALYGIIKAKHKKIVKFLMVQITYLVIIASLIVYLIIDPLEALQILELHEKYKLPLICGLILLFGVVSYFLLIVLSYYRELKYNHLGNIVATTRVVNSIQMTSFN
ncbi:uncharacterized protein LOC135834690 isoform X3 [Planococcus citri]|uniref:uncharacterized protein LOC135834690 isoform X3 n=1 Tax=Planococcus citri TaxID=170843 RepID=UPI0031F8C6A0